MLEFFLLLFLILVLWGGWKLIKLLKAYEEDTKSQEFLEEMEEANLRLQAKMQREAVYNEERIQRETSRNPENW
jgi:hypothetical protein